MTRGEMTFDEVWEKLKAEDKTSTFEKAEVLSFISCEALEYAYNSGYATAKAEFERPQGDLISREWVKNNVLSLIDPETRYYVKLKIDSAPTVEPKRPKGEWINHRNDYGHNIADCSLCGKAMQWHDEDEDGIPKYCWYCGAEMQKGGAV